MVMVMAITILMVIKLQKTKTNSSLFKKATEYGGFFYFRNFMLHASFCIKNVLYIHTVIV